jgi:hypothetical protein
MQRNDGPVGRCESHTGRVPITPDCGIVGRCDEPVPDMPACARCVPEAFAAVTFGPPFKSAGLILSGLKYYHDLHAISQQDKPLINIRLIHHFLQYSMWIITDFSVCTGMTRALPGKRPLLVPVRLRNPQHFHRLCTGLARLRTSHPHVCAQAAGKQACRRPADSSGSAPAPAPARRASTTAGLTSSRRWKPSRGPGCALAGTGMIKVLANRKPLPAADSCRILWDLSVLRAFLLLTPSAPASAQNSSSRYHDSAEIASIVGF